MTIKKSFRGASIRRPGVYSSTRVDNTGGANLATDDTLFLIGEASEGMPGDTEGITEFSANQLSTLITKYKSGPIVDCALAASRPSKTPGITGPGKFLVWKTNSSTQASLNIDEATDTNVLLVIKDKQWGVKGNDLSVTIANGTNTATQKLITISRLNDVDEELGENDGLAIMTIQYTGDSATALMTITGASKQAKTLATTLSGAQSDGSVNLSIALKNYTMKELRDFIAAQTGYTATMVTNTYAAKDAVEMDPVTALSIKTVKSAYRFQEEIVELINDNSDWVEASLHATPRAGLTVNISDSFLTGGAQGASVPADFTDGLTASLAKTYNVALPCISRDASVDIADGEQGFTDASSTYTIAAVLSALDSHLRLRGSIKNRKEAMGMGGVRNATIATALASIATVGSELVQIGVQDVLVLDVNSEITWKHPHVFAALCAGIRLGTEIGEPLTHKRLNCSAIGHFVDPTDGLEDGNFNTDTGSDDAIDNGCLFAEKVGSIFRIVVDNTSYGTDDSFVFNRGSVMEAAQFVAKDIRKVAEEAFVGKKTSNGAAASMKSVIQARLEELNKPEINILTSSVDAPLGFVEETFVVEQTGNTFSVQVEIKVVQAIEFVFISFQIGDIRQSA